MKSIITKEMIRNEGFVFENEDDEALFIEFVQKEFERIVGEKVVQSAGQKKAFQLAEAALSDDEKAINSFIYNCVPEYESIVTDALSELKDALKKNRENNEKLKIL